MAEPPDSGAPSDRVSSLERLGSYALVTQLPGGALGARWAGLLTEGREQGRLVSVRRVTLHDTKSRAAQWLFDAGNRVVQLRHPKVAAVLDVLKCSGEVAIVSEYLEGEPLSSLLRLAVLESVPMPPPVALGIIRDLLDAMLAAKHSWDRQVTGSADPLRLALHGGITPDVVMVARYGEAMLLDVGLTGAAARLPRILKHPSALPYRAPEQLKRTAPVDERADVYSLGVLLWEMLASRPLFGAPDRLRHPETDQLEQSALHELEDEILSRDIPTLDSIGRTGTPLGAAVVHLVARALARSPMQRFAGLKDMRSAVQALPSGMVASAEQVATATDRFARALMDSRRIAIEAASGARLMESTPPESTRSTRRPAPPSRPITMLVAPTPLATAEIARASEVGFGKSEGPTMPASTPAAKRVPDVALPPRPWSRPASGLLQPEAKAPPRPSSKARAAEEKVTTQVGLGPPSSAPSPQSDAAAEPASAPAETVDPETIQSLKLAPLPPRARGAQLGAAGAGGSPAAAGSPEASAADAAAVVGMETSAAADPDATGQGVAEAEKGVSFAQQEVPTTPSARAATDLGLQQAQALFGVGPSEVDDGGGTPAVADSVVGPREPGLGALPVPSAAEELDPGAPPTLDLGAAAAPTSLIGVEAVAPPRRGYKPVLLASAVFVLVVVGLILALRVRDRQPVSEPAEPTTLVDTEPSPPVEDWTQPSAAPVAPAGVPSAAASAAEAAPEDAPSLEPERPAAMPPNLARPAPEPDEAQPEEPSSPDTEPQPPGGSRAFRPSGI